MKGRRDMVLRLATIVLGFAFGVAVLRLIGYNFLSEMTCGVLKGQRKSEDFFSSEQIRIFDSTSDISHLSKECVPLKVKYAVIHNPTICIYNVSEDIYVSGSLKTHGVHEGGILGAIAEHIKSRPEMILLDVGCNIGTYSLYAIALGHKVIAIDAFQPNLQLLNKSVHLVHQKDNIMLLWNAVSDVHEMVFLGKADKNVGANSVLDEDKAKDPKIKKAAEDAIPTITLNDLVTAIKLENKTIFFKMDIEGMEHKALIGASELFKRNNVCFVVMEVKWQRHAGRQNMIMDLMKNFGFTTYSDGSFKTVVTDKNVNGNDAFFAKPSCLKEL